ncbi:MAG: isoprenylcysteine carboxyl methyltransferase [Candidatus Peribacter riflensis]|uniref:Isoprenylcysteine carboxyl methyltransferase n=1 Tax=Candidatus Peribacter riflensis TaxID=1735162 RepID=A0A0S1SGM1_9BACT|nr:MAG: isoprenylcysteine carboxyl methyltransferase [Candidatus Peribacter riflensis]OGJ76706.1 MAG: hypothetical protein A2398_03705 [Candidatus Peribacteria bacterium RIFOXYB1_FULL_57_12]OGJ82061.1 MAG: hypothetical protein A2412_05125 [Candidatus Peribacteria bacterium RIFOXYC1_FULL_58_8]ALM10628.1 MAG: isoprenylcysteine carboxyl methyltransferase [Candidatus Peribacter riflensis]ALM11730.1 MAG: isoprenylcysteine carboxyl methyltransferase [Candidatus Peribacter riflensis]
MTQMALLRRLAATPLGIFDIVMTTIVLLCVVAIFVAVILNFAGSNTQHVRKERRSIVETGTMTAFFLVYYLCARFQVGALPPPPVALHISIACLSLVVIVGGTLVNIWGRVALGHNWANQIKMYENQTFIHSGPYSFVRHPLYASLVWMFFAGSFLYFNWLLFLLTVVIFLPFMTWRARQEEMLLEEQFPGYSKYRKITGMFFPKLLRFHL